ncbi:MAG: AI-2E family transporter [Fusobacterium sp.]|uniref:AI-2E family transporter n=1 Tax=Fusobacterium sp. TaxID=68766 RepID=UPI0026DBD7B7|nr:AI-2E family transporter [Fusobacterium sp.]MDO4690562.1 AI-2E family transporter [Fusobacterium sp.]
MKRKVFLKIIILIFIFVSLQTYFQNNEDFKAVVTKWTGYFVPLIWAIFISVLLSPIMEFFQKKFKINKLLSLIIAIVLIIVILIALIFMVVPEIVDSIKELNQMYPDIVDRVTNMTRKIMEFLAEKRILAFNQEEIIKSTSDLIKTNFSDIQKFIISILQNVVWWAIGMVNFFIGLFLAVLILLDKKTQIRTRDNIITIIFGEKRAKYIIEKIGAANEIFINYVIGKIIVSFVVGFSVFIVLIVSKTPYASLSAILLGLGNMIPYVGSIVGGLIASFLIFMIAPIKLIFLLIAIVISQLLDGFVVGPKIIGDKVGLNTFWVMLSILIFGGLFGLVGMFLGVPIMSIIKLFYTDLINKVKREES